MVSKTSFPAELMGGEKGDRREDRKGPCLECSTRGCHPQHHKWSPMPPPGVLSVHREPVSPEHFWVWAQNLKYKGGESSSKAHPAHPTEPPSPQALPGNSTLPIWRREQIHSHTTPSKSYPGPLGAESPKAGPAQDTALYRNGSSQSSNRDIHE